MNLQVDWKVLERALQYPLTKHRWVLASLELFRNSANQRKHWLFSPAFVASAVELINCLDRVLVKSEQQCAEQAFQKSGCLSCARVFALVERSEQKSFWCLNREFAAAGRSVRRHELQLARLLHQTELGRDVDRLRGADLAVHWLLSGRVGKLFAAGVRAIGHFASG